MELFRNFFENRIGAVIFFTGWFAISANASGLQVRGVKSSALPSRLSAQTMKNLENKVVRLPGLSLKSFDSKDRRLINGTQKLLKRLFDRGRYNELNDLSHHYYYLAELSRKGALNAQRRKILIKQLAFNYIYFSKYRSPGGSYATKVFPGSNLVWTYFSGYGWQIHPLSSLKRSGWLAYYGQYKRFISAMNEVLDSRALRGRRKKFLANEYYFPWEGFRWPWISSLAEGVKLPLLARAIQVETNAKKGARYYASIEDSLRVFETGFRSGGVDDNSWYLEYAFHNRERVLNGFQFSLLGLYDFYGKVAADPRHFKNRVLAVRSKRLFDKGIAVLYRDLPRYDLGNWSRYSLIESPASPVYNKIHVDNLRRLARAATNPKVKRRFSFYADRWAGRIGSR